jgi:hypothetical protein
MSRVAAPLIDYIFIVQISRNIMLFSATNTAFQAQLVQAAQTMAWKTAP